MGNLIDKIHSIGELSFLLLFAWSQLHIDSISNLGKTKLKAQRNDISLIIPDYICFGIISYSWKLAAHLKNRLRSQPMSVIPAVVFISLDRYKHVIILLI